MTLASTRSTVAFGIFGVCVALAAARLPAQEGPGSQTPVPVPVPAADKQIKEVVDAVERFKKLDFNGALMMFNEAAKKHPELPPGEISMAKLFYQLKEARAYRYWLEQAVAEQPDDPEAYIFIAAMALNEGRRCEASLVFAKANSLMAGFENAERKKLLEPRVYSGLAAVAERRREWETAKTHLESWLKLEPNNAQAMQRLAHALFQLRNPQGALDQLKAAKAADSTVLNPYVQLGMMYQQVPDYKNAKIWMDHAEQTAPRDVDTLFVITQWCLDTGDLVRAEKLAASALRLSPDSLRAMILRGVVALYKKDYSAGEGFFQSALLQAPNDFAAKNNLALALCEQPNDTKKRLALDYAFNNAKMYQNSPDAASTYGWVLFMAGRVQDADNVLSRLARAGRVNEDTAYFIARVAAERGRKDEAITILKRALESKRHFSKKDDAEDLLKELQK